MISISKEKLEELYIRKGHSIREVSEITDVSYKRIYNAMKIFNLKRRNLSEAFLEKRKRNPKILECKLCGSKICLENYLHGTGLCRICANKAHSIKMLGKMSGKKHPLYIDGRSSILKHCIDCGCKISVKATRCSSCCRKGKLHVRFNNATSLYRKIRTSKIYNNWRLSIFKRDNYICKHCNIRGGKLEVHHKIEFIDILNCFLNTNIGYSLNNVDDLLFLFEKSTKYKPFWDLENGITLCKDCHKNKHSKIN